MNSESNSGDAPKLFAAGAVRPGEIPQVDYHMHTSWTDGSDGTMAVHEAALTFGLDAILFSEHARKSSGDWFPDFAREVRALPQDRCRSFVGVESKVDDFDGNLDCAPEIIELCDLVMASVHRFPGETGAIHGKTNGYSAGEAVDIEYRLSCAVVKNPAVDILGHPFGMSLKRFNTVPPDRLVRDLIAQAALHGVAFEINAHYHPEPWQWLTWCTDAGATISLGSNAHRPSEVGSITRMLEAGASKIGRGDLSA